MKGTKIFVCTILSVILTMIWIASASAWTFGLMPYAYTGTWALRGTIPGKIYHLKAASISNFTEESRELTVDLYYSNVPGNYEYSPDGGLHWISIANDVETWTRTLSAGETIWLRVVFRDREGNVNHLHSPCPWGVAEMEMDEEYYFAFPPVAHYYNSELKREILGYVAVIRP